MRIIRKILNWVSVITIVVGVCLIIFSYLTNRSFLAYITNILNDAQFGTTFKHILIGFGLVILGLILFSFGLRLGSRIRKVDRERKEEEKKNRELEEARNRKVKEEAESARAEAEQLKKEAEEAKAQLYSMIQQPTAEHATVTEETETETTEEMDS